MRYVILESPGRPEARHDRRGVEMTRRYQVISADGHVETPPDPWIKHVPAKWKDRALRLVSLEGGGEGWVIENQPLLKNGQNITGRKPVSFDAASYYREDGTPAE